MLQPYSTAQQELVTRGGVTSVQKAIRSTFEYGARQASASSEKQEPQKGRARVREAKSAKNGANGASKPIPQVAPRSVAPAVPCKRDERHAWRANTTLTSGGAIASEESAGNQSRRHTE